MKYTFNPGEDIPAESFQTLDPNNPVAQSPAQLIGGDDVVLQNFIDLGIGDNDGKFTANIDGTEYEDLSIDLSTPESTSSNKIIQETSNSTKSYFTNHAQSFNSGNLVEITAIKFKIRSDVSTSNTTTISLRLGVGLSGTVIGTVVASLSQNDTGDKIITATFSSPISVSPNTNYTFTFSACSNKDYNMYIYYKNSDVYADGHCWLTGTEQTGYDLYFDIIGKYLDIFVNGANSIASMLQTAIRTATSKLETVVYDTDHFEITDAVAGRTGNILKLTAPTTGTDISGAGYLDLGANATEVAGAGDDYKLVRLDEDGQVPLSKLTKVISTCPEGYDIMFNDTQAYSTSSNSFVRIFSLKFNRTGNYKIKSWGWSGGKTGYIELRNGASVLLSRSFSDTYEPSTTLAPFLNDLFIIQAGTTIDIYIKSSQNSSSVSIKNFTVQASQFTTPTIERS